MDLAGVLQKALQVSQAALPDVTRAYVAEGPELALTCRLLAVYAAPITVVQSGPGFAGGCGVAGPPSVVVVYAKDCLPMADVAGGTAKLPDPAAVTAWSLDYYADVVALYDALAGEAAGDGFGDPNLSCSATIGTINFAGPRGGVANVRIPITAAYP